MKKIEAYDIIEKFSAVIAAIDNFDYDEALEIMQKTEEALKEFPDLNKYVEDDFIRGVNDYKSDFYSEYIAIFSQIMRAKKTPEQKNYLSRFENINSNLQADFDISALEINPELFDIIAERNLQMLYNNDSPNFIPNIMELCEYAPSSEICKHFLEKAFNEKVKKIYRNKNLLQLGQIYEKYPELEDFVFDIIKKSEGCSNYFKALADIAVFDKYKAEEAICCMHAKVQYGIVDEAMLVSYFTQLKIICDAQPRFKQLIQEHCRDILTLKENTERTLKYAARVLEDEKALSSHVSIGKKIEKCASNKFGYKKVDSIPADEVCVFFLGGNGTKDDEVAHGYIKPIVELLKENGLSDKVNVYGITYDFGDYFKLFQALETQMKNYGHKPLRLPEFFADMNEDTKNPQFINQLFDKFILPRISRLDGKVRLSTNQAAENMNRLKIVAHCFGGYAALELEKLSLNKMKELGYSSDEAKTIQGQLQIIAMNPYCPLGVQKSDMFSVISAQDNEVTHNNFFEKYVRHLVYKGKNIPLCFFKKEQGNFLLVNRMYGSDNRRNDEIDRDEHSYYGFKILPAHSEKGKIAVKFLQNALLNGLKSALKGEIRTLSTRDLLAADAQDLADFDTATANGKIFYNKLVEYTFAENNKNLARERRNRNPK